MGYTGLVTFKFDLISFCYILFDGKVIDLTLFVILGRSQTAFLHVFVSFLGLVVHNCRFKVNDQKK